MSDITDELRDEIEEYFSRDPADIFREALDHTIEERNALIDMYNGLKAENAKLREDNDRLVQAIEELHSVSLEDRLVQLEGENSRLRKLLQDVAICASGNYCYDCPHQHDGCDRDERLRAEGIEVPE